MQKTKRRTNIKDIILEHINNNIKDYLIIIIIFLIGLVIGVIYINNSSQVQQEEASSYITNTVTSLKENSSVDKFGLLRESITKNFLLGVFLWFIGLAVISIPIVYVTIAFRGFSLGFSIGSAVVALGIGKAIIFTLTTIFLQNIIFIPTIFALAVSGIKLYKTITKKDRREVNIKKEILKHTIFSGIAILVLILSSFIEVYISSNLLVIFINYI